MERKKYSEVNGKDEDHEKGNQVVISLRKIMIKFLLFVSVN